MRFIHFLPVPVASVRASILIALELMTTIFLGTSSFVRIAQADMSGRPTGKNVALVYRGPGACDEGCSDAAALIAERSGLSAVYVGPAETDPHLFDRAAVWIQPGGTSRLVGRTMTEALKDRIRDFVRNGGAYVGFCAGGFFATDRIGQLEDRGLGLIPGRSALFAHADADATLVDLKWGAPSVASSVNASVSAVRSVYWEGGPSFYAPTDDSPSFEITATYPDGTAASVRAAYGAGRAYVTGAHPEAPQAWRNYFHLQDRDGLDYDLAVEMIRWATRSRHTEE